MNVNSNGNGKTNNGGDLVMPLESAEFVMQNAKSVQINPEGIDTLANKVLFSLNYFNSFF